MYTPAPHALDHLRKVDFVAVIGPTAAGKSTIIDHATQQEPTLHLVLNNTSRARRPDEREGVDFRFETRVAMEARIARGEYAQVAPSVFGDLYATAAEDYATEGVALLPVLADAVPAFRALPFRRMRSIFVIPPDWDTWQGRVAQRNFPPETLSKRMAEARRSLEFALTDQNTAFVIGRTGGRSTDDFITVALSRPMPDALREDQRHAQMLASDLLQKLDNQAKA